MLHMKYSILVGALILGSLTSVLLADVEPAVPVRTAPPEYPMELRRERVSGRVIVTFTVNEKGDVVDPAVVKSTRTEFERPALAAVKRWKFKPARENGVPVAKAVTVPMEFVMQE